MECMRAIDILPSNILRLVMSAWPEYYEKTMKYGVPARPPITTFAFLSPLPTD
jgi:hypothetical protein